MVYPANAGFMQNRDDPALSLSEKIFYLSNMISTRRGETDFFRDFLEERGLVCRKVFRRFEGEADLILSADIHIFTSGLLEKQRFVPALSIPPWRRVYGFRSDPKLVKEIEKEWGIGDVLQLTLINEAHYHGDTVVCPFGQDRKYVLAYLNGLNELSRHKISSAFGDKLVVIDEKDARMYAANSFQIEVDDRAVLIMPEGVSDDLIEKIRARDTDVETVNVSEFWMKGGGSVKCMIGDLGRWTK